MNKYKVFNQAAYIFLMIALLSAQDLGASAAKPDLAPVTQPRKALAAQDYGAPVDVATFGASPTASPTQNVTAINAALAAKHFVHITRPGVYQLNDHLTIFPHTKLICGPGVTIQQTAVVCMIRNAHMLATPRDSDITIEGGTWDDNYKRRCGNSSRHRAMSYGI